MTHGTVGDVALAAETATESSKPWQARRGSTIRPTPRGAGLLGAAPAFLAVGIVSGISVLLLAGLLIGVLLAVAVLWLRWRTTGVHLAVVGRPAVVPAGQPISVRVAVTSRQRDGAWLQVWPGIPAEANWVDQRSLQLLHGRAIADFTTSLDRRGAVTWPEAEVVLADPFGLWQSTRRAGDQLRTVVLPVPEHLPPAGAMRALSDAAGGGAASHTDLAARVAVHTANSPVPREYRVGDELRRIHWAATARRHLPMVRTEDDITSRRCVLVLDRADGRYHDQGSFERAIVACASIAEYLLSEDWQVHVVDHVGRPLGTDEGSIEIELSRLLHDLAVLEAAREAQTPDLGAIDQPIVVVTGAAQSHLIGTVEIAARIGRTGGIAVTVDGGTPTGRGRTTDVAPESGLARVPWTGLEPLGSAWLRGLGPADGAGR